MTSVILVKRLNGVGDWNRIEISLSSREIRRGQVTVGLTPQEFRLASVLVGGAASQRCFTISELIDVVFGDRADGGPETADSSIRVRLYNIRQSLASIGIVIPVVYSRGYRAEILATQPIHHSPRQVFTRRRQPLRAFRSTIEQIYDAVLGGRCEEALAVLEETFPAYRLGDLGLERVSA
ncbi:winged helix-turn-helix domain-containing protein [Mesorhizobium sp. WSM3626]|uniref:winged helix-turn-helix domain-containing protein n=1 Tax=Mesorhizobium sp. WSM3626 TaxID=1040987 RepID=UPI00048422F5|nr:winged helix-turn-helix domain-containing protein [Mesorhizobium sp. WSM3626]